MDTAWVTNLYGSEVGTFLLKKAGYSEDLQYALERAKETYNGLDANVRNALTWGGAGAGGAGLLSALSPSRPGEDATERIARILRNAALGGAAAGGAAYAIPTGADLVTAPQQENAHSRQLRLGNEELHSVPGVTVGAAGGSGLGAMLGFLFNRKNRALNSELLRGSMAHATSLGDAAALKPTLNSFAKQTGGIRMLNRLRGAAKGGIGGGIIGGALPLILGMTDSGTSAYNDLKQQLMEMKDYSGNVYNDLAQQMPSPVPAQ